MANEIDLTGKQAARDVHARLERELRHGVYQPGHRLPTERDLSEQHGVSRATLRLALSALEDQGLVTRSAKRGWFVATPEFGEPPSVLQSFSELARSRGMRATSTVLHEEVRAVTLDEAQTMRVAPGSQVLDLTRLRGMDSSLVCIDNAVIPLGRVPGLEQEDFTQASLYEAMRSHGGVISRTSCKLQALAATAEQRKLLSLPGDTPVLVSRSITFDTAGIPLIIGVTTFRGDAYRFEADLYVPQQD